MSSSRSAAFLMANLGSEVSQLFMHREQGEAKYANFARERAQKIIAELLEHPETQGRTGEIEILQKIVESTTRIIEEQREIPRAQIEEYFLPFALRVLNA